MPAGAWPTSGSTALFELPGAPAVGARAVRGQPRAAAQNSHKGSFGDVAVLGGARGMAGAAVLAGARGAVRRRRPRVRRDARWRHGARSAAAGTDVPLAAGFEFAGRVLVLGPGMGDAMEAMRLLGKALDGARRWCSTPMR
jgi:NAD(P)H-hydrate repair Nnr-like enzyme with NAD(P)H-hydrate dehydratase domain